MITCKECGHECSAQNALGYHLRTHSISYVDYVIKHEHDGVWPTCKCGSRLIHKKGGFSRFCSRSCAASGEDNAMGRLKGAESPNYGQRRTEEQRKNYSSGAKKRWEIHGDKLRAMMKTDEYKQAQSEAQRASYVASDRAERVSISINRFWSSDSPETKTARKSASDRAILSLSLGKIGPQAPFKTLWMTNPFTGKEEYMHSSQETAFLERCIREHYPVTKEHDLRIPYVAIDGTDHVYVPDFVGLCENVVFEIKGLLRENDPAKLAALESWASHNDHEVVFTDVKP